MPFEKQIQLPKSPCETHSREARDDEKTKRLAQEGQHSRLETFRNFPTHYACTLQSAMSTTIRSDLAHFKTAKNARREHQIKPLTHAFLANATKRAAEQLDTQSCKRTAFIWFIAMMEVLH